jgi:hypothetical protein
MFCKFVKRETEMKKPISSFRYRPPMWVLAIAQGIFILLMWGLFESMNGHVMFFYVTAFIITIVLLFAIRDFNGVAWRFLYRWESDVSPRFLRRAYYTYILSFIVFPIIGLFWYRKHRKRYVGEDVARKALERMAEREKAWKDWRYIERGEGGMGLVLNMYESLITLLQHSEKYFTFRYGQWRSQTENNIEKGEIRNMGVTRRLFSLAHEIGDDVAVECVKKYLRERPGRVQFNDAMFLAEHDRFRWMF